MPYKSKKQAGYMHSKGAKMPPKVVEEMDAASKGMTYSTMKPKAKKGKKSK